MNRISLNILLIFIVQQFHSQDLSVDKIWKNYEFRTKGVDGFRSMKDGESYTQVIDNSIYKFKINSSEDQGTLLIDKAKLIYKNSPIKFDDYFFNIDETKVLFTTATEPIYRRSFSSIYYLFDLSTGQFQPLDEERQPQTLAEYSPDGTMVSYIYKNDLFVKNIKTGKVSKLTKGGKKNKVIYGTTDWVYEEEFAITKAYEWSPDSKLIAFLRFDEQEVKEFNLTYYDNLYPTNYKYKYPKAGEDNSKVTAHIVQVKNSKTININLGEYEYIPRLSWSKSENKLVLQTLNRHQNHLKYHLIDLTGKPSNKVFFEEKSDTYVEIDNNLMILKDGKSILRTSENDGYNHIYRLNFDGTSQQITKGNWDVIEFLGINEKSGTIFYASAENSPMTKSVYKVQLDGSSKEILSPSYGYSEAEFTNGMNYFVLTHSTANTPPVYSLRKSDGSLIRILEDNKDLSEKIASYKPVLREFVKFNSNGTDLNGWMIKPKNFDPTKKYPVYMTVYAGPGHNEVIDSWDGMDYMYYQLLAEKGYIVACVDPRGTMYRGAKFKKSTYLQLGKLEIEDVINTAKELQKLPYVAADRIGIMGWSYGGFMASLAITKGADVFKLAIAVAPVTNWRYYDNIYTERFMRTPKENQAGYDDNSPINHVKNIKGKYFLIHGSTDDNVHYQNAMEMVNALVKANKQFDMFIYPNRNHGIYGGNTRNHLFNMMFDYTIKNL